MFLLPVQHLTVFVLPQTAVALIPDRMFTILLATSHPMTLPV